MAEFDTLMSRLDGIQTALNRLLGMSLGDARRDKKMVGSVDELKKAVAEQKDATQSAVTLIEGLADQLDDAGGDEAAVAEIAAEIRSSAQALAKAVTENTPFSPSGQ
jgi:hypothetical protein